MWDLRWRLVDRLRDGSMPLGRPGLTEYLRAAVVNQVAQHKAAETPRAGHREERSVACFEGPIALESLVARRLQIRPGLGHGIVMFLLDAEEIAIPVARLGAAGLEIDGFSRHLDAGFVDKTRL